MRRIEVEAVVELLFCGFQLSGLRFVGTIERVKCGFAGILLLHSAEHLFDAFVLCCVGVEFHNIVREKLEFLFELKIGRLQGVENFAVVGDAVAFGVEEIGTGQIDVAVS